MRPDPGSIVRPDPIAFFLTWTTYGSWLPGDPRGWTDSRGRQRAPEDRLRGSVARRLQASGITLSNPERRSVEVSIAAVCRLRGWCLHAVNCRTQHVHVVVTVGNLAPAQVMQQLKAWASRALDAPQAEDRERPRQQRRWTRGGSMRLIRAETDLDAVVKYVRECQDSSRFAGSADPHRSRDWAS
jgi:REP element-mobilizing transposase RayT